MSINDIDTNWYKSPPSVWNPIQQDLTQAENAYDTALQQVTNYYTNVYGPAKTDLETAIANNTVTQAMRDDFNDAQVEYNSRINTLKTATTAYLNAKAAALSHIDTQGEVNFDSYITTLKNELVNELKLTGNVTNTSLVDQLDQRFNNFTTSRNTFLSALSSFRTAQNNLTNARVALQALEDQYLLAQADEELGIGDASGELAARDAKHAEIFGPPDPGLYAVRNSAQATLSTAVTTYKSDIDSLLSILNTAKNRARTVSNQFETALITEKATAFSLFNDALSDAAEADEAARLQHFEDFPVTADAVQDLLTESGVLAQTKTDAALASGLDRVNSVTTDIEFPVLTPGKAMSINDLMRFISKIQLLIDNLVRLLETTDKNINELRLKIWNYQASGLVDVNTILTGYAQVIKDADAQYIVDVANANIANSEKIAQILNSLKQPEVLDAINAVIDKLNDEIDAQNQSVADAYTALQNSQYISADVINEVQKVEPDTVNLSDITNEDVDVPYPSNRNDLVFGDSPHVIAHIPHLTAADIDIPSSFPMVADDPTKPVAIDNLPDEPSAEDITDLNLTIAAINNLLYPIRERLLTDAGFLFQFIQPFFLRETIEVRDTSAIIDPTQFTTNTEIANAIFALVKLAQRERDIKNALLGSPTLLDKRLEINIRPITVGSNTTTAGLGAGVGIQSADTLSSQSKLSSAVNTVLSSESFQNGVDDLLGQAGILGGLAGITRLPTRILNYSQLGVVRADLGEQQGQNIEEQLQIADLEGQKAAISSLVSLAGKGDTLKQKAIEIISKLDLTTLNEDEIKELIALLVALLALLLLLVAALLSAAVGGETNIDQVVAAIFEKPEDRKVTSVVQNLNLLGVELPKTLTPSTPRFEEQFLNALVPNLTPERAKGLTQELTTLFQEKGITLDRRLPLGTAAQEALANAPIEIRPDLRDSIIAISVKAGEDLQGEILADELRRPTLASRINDEIARRIRSAPSTDVEIAKAFLDTVPEFTPLSRSEQDIFIAALLSKTITPEQARNLLEAGIQESIRDGLRRGGALPEGFTEEDRNTFSLAVGLGAISTPQARGVVQDQLVQNALQTSPDTANLLRDSFTPTSKPVETPTADAVVRAASLVGRGKTDSNLDVEARTESPSTRPKDLVALLGDEAITNSLNLADNRFAREVALALADKVRGQTDFYSRSLDLFLSPIGVFNRAFSIFTQGADKHERPPPTILNV